MEWTDGITNEQCPRPESHMENAVEPLMNKLKVLILMVCIAVCSTGCSQGQDVYVPEYYPYSWNANSGDTVIVIMNPDGDVLQRCEDMGGELIYIPSTLIYQCEKVDF